MKANMSYLLRVCASNDNKLVEERFENLEDLQIAIETYHEVIKRECWAGAYILVNIEHFED